MRRALRRRRRLRICLVQAIFVAVALVLALVMPSLDAGPDIDNDTVTTLLFSLASGLIALITLVFSLLFLVVPYANTSLSPRLTLFRDDPVVWRSFAFFVAVFVFLTVSGLGLSGDREVSVYVAFIALLLVPAGDHTSSGRLLRMVEVGADRTFDQDPLFAFRLLVDIDLAACRAPSTTPSRRSRPSAGCTPCCARSSTATSTSPGWPTVRARFVCC